MVLADTPSERIVHIAQHIDEDNIDKDIVGRQSPVAVAEAS